MRCTCTHCRDNTISENRYSQGYADSVVLPVAMGDLVAECPYIQFQNKSLELFGFQPWYIPSGRIIRPSLN